MNSKLSFSSTSCLTKAEGPSLPYYVHIAGWRIIGFIPFPRVLVLCVMQSVSSRIWSRVAVSISYDDNHYTTGTLIYFSDCNHPVKCSLMQLPFYSFWGNWILEIVINLWTNFQSCILVILPNNLLGVVSYRKGSLRVTLDYGRQLYFTLRGVSSWGNG